MISPVCQTEKMTFNLQRKAANWNISVSVVLLYVEMSASLNDTDNV